MLFISSQNSVFCYVRKRHDKKAKVKFKIDDVTNWDTNNYNKHISKYFKK